MKNFVNVLDDLVLKIKKMQEFSLVRFIHAGRGAFAEKPVEGFVVACSVAAEEFKGVGSKNEEYKGTMEFTLYAPQGEGKRALTLLAQKFAESLKVADGGGNLETIIIADSTFDSNMSVWKQTVSATFAENAEAVSEAYFECVYLGSRKLEEVTSFEVSGECSAYELRELFAAGTDIYINPVKKYTISLMVYGGDLLLDAFANKAINIYRETTDMTYDDCRLVKIQNKANGRQDLTFVCKRAHKGAEVTA